jgi:non-ribosomal peptide synthetase component F/pimeloyl-ACP methyl ester carboxylesterase
LEGALPLDAEEPSRPFEESQTTASWWSQQLSEAAEPRMLRVYPRRAGDWPTRTRAESHLTMDRGVSVALQKLCRQLGVSPRDAFLAIWGLVVGRLTNGENLTLLASCSVSGPRNLGWGLIENILPALVSIRNERTATEWLKEVAREEEERRYHAAMSLPHVLQSSQPSRALSTFPIAFFWLPTALNDRIHRALPRWIRFDVKVVQRSLFPFTLEVRSGQQFELRVEFDPNFYPSSEATNLLERIVRVTESVVKDPAGKVGSLTILTRAESEIPQPMEHGRLREKPSLTLQEKITTVITRQPLSLAIEGPNDTALSFAELDSCAKLLAAHLCAEDPAHRGRVATCLTPTPWLPVAMLGILLGGKTCVPLDPNSSAAWLASKLTALDVKVVLCDSITAPLFANLAHKLIILDQKWDVITATSSGEVPTVADLHPALVLVGTEVDEPPTVQTLSSPQLLEACLETISLWDLQPGERIPLLTTGGTAAFAEIVLSAILAGATIILLGEGELAATLGSARPSHLRLTSAQWRNWITGLRGERAAFPGSLRCVCIEQNILPPAIHRQWQEINDGQARTIFFSSPVGFSGWSLNYEAGDRPGLSVCLTEIPLGTPGPGVVARLLDSAGHSVPPRYPGQLTIQLRDQAEKFTALAWRDKSGLLHLVPSDNELVERSLTEIAGVQDAHCVTMTSGGARRAWLILQDRSLDVSEAIQSAIRDLPKALQPDHMHAVAEFPLTAGGRIDSARLHRWLTDARTKSSAKTRHVDSVTWQPLLLLHATPDAPTLFLVHDIEGSPEKYRELIRLLAEDWTLIGTTARGLTEPTACHQTVESEAAALVEAVRMQDPDGPYHLFGYGFGAVLAFEMAHRLREAGSRVRYLALTGSRAPLLNGKADDWMRSLSRAFSRSGRREVSVDADTGSVEISHANALREFRARPLSGPCCVIMGTNMAREHETAWRACAPDAEINRLKCDPDQMLTQPTVKILAAMLREYAKTSFN